MNFCWQSDVSAFSYAILVSHSFFSKEQVSFNFMVTVTVHSDFAAQGGKKKSLTVSTVSPSICNEMMEPDAMIFIFFEC